MTSIFKRVTTDLLLMAAATMSASATDGTLKVREKQWNERKNTNNERSLTDKLGSLS